MGERGKPAGGNGGPIRMRASQGTARTSYPGRSWEEQRQAGAGAGRGRAGRFQASAVRSRKQAGSGGRVSSRGCGVRPMRRGRTRTRTSRREQDRQGAVRRQAWKDRRGRRWIDRADICAGGPVQGSAGSRRRFRAARAACRHRQVEWNRRRNTLANGRG